MNKGMFSVGSAGRVAVALLSFAAGELLISQPILAASSNACVTVQLDAPFRLPDGVVHPAGELRLCNMRSYSPVADFHVVLVNGAAVGQFQSRRRSTETGDMDAPEVVFEREPAGILALVGYIVPSGRGSVAFRMKGEGEAWQASRRNRVDGSSPAPVAAMLATAGTH